MAVQLSDIVKNRMKEKLARGEVVSSMTVRLVRTIEIAYIARTAGFDSIYVDIEHNSFSFDAVGQICIAAMEAGVTPLVRVPTRRSEYVSRVLDGGAMGVIVPHIRSAAEAREVVAAAKFPPLGERSASGGLPHLQYRSFPIADANKALNDALSLPEMIILRKVLKLRLIATFVAVVASGILLVGYVFNAVL